VNVPLPPDLLRVLLDATPTRPGPTVVVLTEGAAYVVNVNCFVPVCPWVSETWTVKVEAPIEVGVPVSTPAELSVTHAGKVPAVTDQTKGATPVPVPRARVLV